MQTQTGFRFRCYPTPAQAQVLMRWIGCQRFIYASIASLERAFHNGTIPQPDEGAVTGTVRALAKDANANVFALVEDVDGKAFAVPVSDTDLDQLAVGETATFEVVRGSLHCAIATTPTLSSTGPTETGPGRKNSDVELE